MSVQITIRDVPAEVRDELASRAALEGKSMQEYLKAQLERLAKRPSPAALMEKVRERKGVTRRRISPGKILSSRDKDRK